MCRRHRPARLIHFFSCSLFSLCESPLTYARMTSETVVGPVDTRMKKEKLTESDGSPDADMKGKENRHLGPVTPIKKAASGISKGIPSLGSSFLFISPLMF